MTEDDEIEEMAVQLELEALMAAGAAEGVIDFDEVARSLYAKGWRLPQ